MRWKGDQEISRDTCKKQRQISASNYGNALVATKTSNATFCYIHSSIMQTPRLVTRDAPSTTSKTETHRRPRAEQQSCLSESVAHTQRVNGTELLHALQHMVHCNRLMLVAKLGSAFLFGQASWVRVMRMKKHSALHVP